MGTWQRDTDQRGSRHRETACSSTKAALELNAFTDAPGFGRLEVGLR